MYQAIWAENKDFSEVLISPTMVNDHMPDNVMDALQKVHLGETIVAGLSMYKVFNTVIISYIFFICAL